MPDVYFIPAPGHDGLLIRDIAEIGVIGNWVDIELENGDEIGILVGDTLLGYKLLKHGAEGGGGQPKPLPEETNQDDKILKFRMH